MYGLILGRIFRSGTLFWSPIFIQKKTKLRKKFNFPEWWAWKGTKRPEILEFMEKHFPKGTTYTDFAKEVFDCLNDFDACKIHFNSLLPKTSTLTTLQTLLGHLAHGKIDRSKISLNSSRLI